MKTVLLHMPQGDQTDLWQPALETQGVQVICLPPEVNPVPWLTQHQDQLPDLILMDMGLKASDGSSLLASDVGRWLKDCQAPTALVLVNLREESKIKDMERRWALRQNAVEVLPRLSPQSLGEQLQIVTAILQVPFNQEGLLGMAASQTDGDASGSGSLGSADAYFNRAKARVQQRNFSGAFYDIERALELSPQSPLYFCLRAEIALLMGNKEGANADVSQALQIQPQCPEAFYTRGLIRYRLGNNQPAIADFNQAIKLSGQYYQAFNARGLARFNSGDERGAMQDYNQALRLNPNYVEAYNNRGTLRYAQGDMNGAIQDFSQTIKVNPDYPDAYYNRGNLYNDRGEFKAAIEDYSAAIRCNPSFAQAYGNRGMAYYEIDDVKQACVDTLKAAELFKQQGDLSSFNQAMETYREMQTV